MADRLSTRRCATINNKRHDFSTREGCDLIRSLLARPDRSRMQTVLGVAAPTNAVSRDACDNASTDLTTTTRWRRNSSWLRRLDAISTPMSPAGSGQPRRCRASTGLPQPRGRPMVEGKRNVSHASTKYWVTVILATSWQCQRFDSESDALAYAQVYARLPNAEAVVAYAYRPVRSLRRRQHHRYAADARPHQQGHLAGARLTR